MKYRDSLAISALIPTSWQTRKNSDNQPDNSFAIDYYVFDWLKKNTKLNVHHWGII